MTEARTDLACPITQAMLLQLASHHGTADPPPYAKALLTHGEALDESERCAFYSAVILVLWTKSGTFGPGVDPDIALTATPDAMDAARALLDQVTDASP